ncbi:MAG: 5,10-methylenetetrahydrofolate reductase [Omnitrophica bacterium RIFCSPLOWO2_02_FULL_45_16]|nr:MAG: 5,10-methylenetetrahydrofolate reductase [Omnitrophica bacterium RIFCSPHIGHO2_02_FULL_46_20]OGW93459.1 MAG: 5,10-methylenetetrahydrofolate reductase [Omnitrophica bacterium RIFCSPLOWO2_12_FULL_45_13]OGW95013.1 MAG: 5,10-methylenetetrahydrofolate reductase [Omnitrophica bacterium RIFCSPLOWO2_01_FULL_45_24]OGW99858.1 MAG: 5,10-methylenetetrahydrofolate reductase [Omnitrophica bacterium RIFCSPLOWO2_02_FULL_45_16]
MTFCDKIKANKFIVTSEIGPPKGIDIKEALEDADLIKGKVDAINVTDLQSSVMRLGSLAVCHLLKDRSIEPIFQIACRDRNRLALQSDLLSAAALGIENVLALTGDYTTLGDHPEAKPVFDLGSIELLDVIKTLQEGKDMKGNALKGAPKFCVGAVVNPGADPLEPEIIKMEKKISSGALFFQTQAVYDIELFKRFLDAAKHLKTTILAGIVLLKSAGMAKYMNKNVAGVFVPDSLIKEMEETKDKSAQSIEIAARLIKDLKPLCQGIHIMPIGWDRKVPLVLSAAEL